ncbi:MAG TPA: hypothetical protein VF461_05640 [Gemmatimonadaceae bacterium]
MSARHSLGVTGLFALAVFAIGCGSTETTPTVTGVWAGRIAYATPNDSFTFYFKQSGAEVQGWGVLRPAGRPLAERFAGDGTLSGGKLDLSLHSLDQTGFFLGAPQYFLRGSLARGQIDATFAFDGANPSNTYPVALRLFRPTASELAGTWVLTSTTGTPAPAGLLDTIVANADGRAWRHREGDLAFGTVAMWSGRDNSRWPPTAGREPTTTRASRRRLSCRNVAVASRLDG